MNRLGYSVAWTDGRKAICYTTPNGYKCRDDRLHDEKYLKGNMEYEFRIREAETEKRRGLDGVTANVPAGRLRDAVGSMEDDDRAFEKQSVDDAVLGEAKRFGGFPQTDRETGTGFGGKGYGQDGQHELNNSPMAEESDRTGWEESREYLAGTEGAGGCIIEPIPADAGKASGIPYRSDGIISDVIRLGHHASKIGVDYTEHPKKKYNVRNRKRGLWQKKEDNIGQDWQQTM